MQLVIIEDDKWFQLTLENLLETYFPEIKILGTAANVKAGISLIEKTQPDFILADIQLGDETIFELMSQVETAHNYNFILTTSHENFALEAISHEVIDYILKPVNLENLTIAINKFKRRYKEKKELQQQSFVENAENKMLGISSVDKIEIVNTDDIVYIKADGRYSHFYLLDGTKKVASKNLGEYEKLLPKETFLRVHHSYLVNMSRVKNIHKTDGYYLELFDSTELISVSKRRQEVVVKFLKLKV